VNEIISSLQKMLIEHLATSEALTVDMAPGAVDAKVANSSRYRPGDEVFLMSTVLNKAEKARVLDVVDWDTLRMEVPTVPGWTVANNSFILKAIGWAPLKRIYKTDLRRLPDFPCLTISGASESNEWITLRATDHDFRISIRVYTQTHNAEESDVLLQKYARATREILIDHIHPVINDATEFHPLTADLPANSTVVSVADTSSFAVNGVVFFRDAQPQPSDEVEIRSILSPTELELSRPIAFTYLVARQAEVLKVNRYLYDTRPSDISYGYVPGSGGSLLRAAEIQWYGKEFRCRAGNILT
jgi:hypothetical protein